MRFFSDVVSALNKLAGDEINLGAEIEAINAAQAAFEANVNAQVAAGLAAQIGPAVASALAAGGITPTAISDLSARVSAIETDETNADNTLVPPTPPAVLTVSPAEADFVAGTASEVALTISGGTGPYTAADLPAGVTFDGANLSADDTAVAGTTSVTISDASTPAVEGTVSVVVAAPAA